MLTQDALDPIRSRLRHVELTFLSFITTYAFFKLLSFVIANLPKDKAMQTLFLTLTLLVAFFLGISYGWFLLNLIRVCVAPIDVLVTALTKSWRRVVLVTAYLIFLSFSLVLFLLYLPQSLGDWGTFVVIMSAFISALLFLHNWSAKDMRPKNSANK